MQTVKQWLSRGRFLKKEIDALQIIRDEEFARCMAVTSKSTVENISYSANPHKMDRLIELDSLLMVKLNELYKIEKEITEAIYKVEDSTLRTLLLYRYISSQTWEQIAVAMSYTYQHVCRLHGRALQDNNLRATINCSS